MRKQSIKSIITMTLLIVAYSQQNIQAASPNWAAQIITSAEQGDSRAQQMLSVMYEKGIGVRENQKSAFDWIKLAASKGQTTAQLLLGWRYATGYEVPKDERRALALFHEATVTGLQQFYETPEPYIFAGGYDGAIRAAKSGNSLAQTIVGKMYLTGAGGTQNDIKAVYWFKQSAEHSLGGAGAQQALAYLYEEGRGGLPKDKHEAMRLYLNVSEQMKQTFIGTLQVMQLYQGLK